MMRRAAGRGRGASQSLAAAAFQDHMARQLQFRRGIPTTTLKQAPLPAPLPTLNDDDIAGAQPKPSLAQKIGLEPKPPAPLSKQEWSDVGRKCAQRSDSLAPCVICREPLSDGAQVLLSCAHVFHKECLQSYEAFTGQRVCPLCRCKEYRKLTISDGREALILRSAVKIQAAWRGYATRQWFRRWTLPRDPLADRLAEASDKYFEQLDRERAEADAILRETDLTLGRTRGLYSCLSPEEWTKIAQAAEQRDDAACPICMASLVGASLYESEDGTRDQKKHPSRGVSLLSCTHMFHTRCICSFEQFNTGGPDTCPICRAMYSRKIYDPPRPEATGMPTQNLMAASPKPAVPTLDLRKAFAQRPVVALNKAQQAAAERAKLRASAAANAEKDRSSAHAQRPVKK